MGVHKKYLSGSKIGKFTLVDRLSERKGLFKCFCGTLFESQIDWVVGGKKISCGCHYYQDLLGKTFNNVEVLSYAGRRNDGSIRLKCRCLLCGKTYLKSPIKVRDTSNLGCSDCCQILQSQSTRVFEGLETDNFKIMTRYRKKIKNASKKSGYKNTAFYTLKCKLCNSVKDYKHSHILRLISLDSVLGCCSKVTHGLTRKGPEFKKNLKIYHRDNIVGIDGIYHNLLTCSEDLKPLVQAMINMKKAEGVLNMIYAEMTP